MGDIEYFYVITLIRNLIYAPNIFHRVMILQRLAGYAARYSPEIRNIMPEIAELAIRSSIYTQKLAALTHETRAGNIIDITETDEFEQLLTTLASLESKIISILDKNMRPLGGIWKNE